MALQQIDVLLAGIRDTSGNVLSGGKVYTYTAGTLTSKATYVDSAGATPATNPIVLDSAGRAQVYAEGAYKLVVDDVNGATIYAWDNLYFARVTSATSQWPDIYGGTSTGSLSVYAVVVPQTISGYSAGQEFRFIANHDTTGATATLNVNSQGAVNLVKGATAAALVAGDIKNGDLVSVIYDSASGGRFRIVSIANNLSGSPLFLDRVNDRVGVGTTAPPYLFSVETSSASVTQSNTRFAADTSATEVAIRKSRGASVGTNTAVVSGDNLGLIGFDGADGTSYPRAARIVAAVDAAVSTNTVPGRIVLSTASTTGVMTERTRWDSAGRMLINTTSNLGSTTGYLQVGGTGTVQTYTHTATLANTEEVGFRARTNDTVRTAGLAVYKHSGITNPCAYLSLQEEDAGDAWYWTDNTGVFRYTNVASNIGTTGGTVVGTQTSDQRLKTVVGPLSYGLDDVAALQPVSYTRNDDTENTPRIGFLAQQVQPIVPEAVYDTREPISGFDPTETKLAMDYSSLIPVLVKAIQELKARVEALESAA